MLRSTVKKSFKWSLLIQLSNQIFGFIITLILARLLSPADFGVIGILTIFISLSKKITDGGLAASLIRTKDVTERDFSTVFYFNLIASLLLYLSLFVASPFIADFFKIELIENILRVYGIIIILSAFTITQSIKLNKELNFKTQFRILLPSLILSGICGISAAYYGLGVWSLVVKEIVFSISASVQLWLYSQWKPLFVFDKDCFKKHFNFGYKLVLTDLISQVFNDSYKAIIGKIFSITQLGFFTRAKSMEELPNQIVFNTINRVLFPMLSQVQNDHNRLKHVYSQIIKLVTFLVTPFLMLLYLIADPLFIFLLTDKWSPAVPYFKILIIAGMIAPLQPYLLNICKVKGRSDLVLKLSMIEYLFILLSMLAIIPYGIIGLLWGLVAASLAKLLVAMIYAGKLIGYSFKNQLFDLKEGFLLSVIGFLFITIMNNCNLLPVLEPLPTLVMIAAVYYSFLLLFCWLFRFESLTLIKLLVKRK
ncbi:MAG: lipopolysaccharide biosynthesis protein [Flavobacterium sp.]|nr:lipopolysaccharide biosynthesis protein [Flavobacterium sp.]